MADVWVDDGGDNTTGTSWATAYTSNAAAITASKFISGNRIFIGDDHNDPDPGANKTYVGPASGLPVILISADRADTGAVPAYKVGTGNQLNSVGAAYNLRLDGSFACYGIKIACGNTFEPASDANESMYFEDCKVALGANSPFYISVVGDGVTRFKRLIVDLTSDGSTDRASVVFSGYSAGKVEIEGLTFINAAFRTGDIFNPTTGNANWKIAGADFSDFTNATDCGIFVHGMVGNVEFTNCRTKATPTLYTGTVAQGGKLWFTNVGSADDPTMLVYVDYFGACASSSAVSRTGGASVESAVCAWLITTSSSCAEGAPFYTPWIYGTIDSTGSKTFTLYITNDTGDFTDGEVWLEIEKLGTSDEADWTIVDDHRVITATAAAQTDDVTSAWAGGAAGFDTFKQSLAVTATINETGQYRARVAIGLASIPSTRDFYVDPYVTVS